MKIKYAIGAVLLAAVMMIPVSAQSCECADPLSVSILCINEGGGMGSAYSSVSGGVAPYSYSWSVTGATMFGGTGSSIFYTTPVAPKYVTVSLTVTDSCGSSKTTLRSCYVGGGAPLKQAASAAENQSWNMTVGQTLDWLTEIKGADFEVVFNGFTLIDALASDALLDMMVADILDESDRVTLMLEVDNVEHPEIDRQAVER